MKKICMTLWDAQSREPLKELYDRLRSEPSIRKLIDLMTYKMTSQKEGLFKKLYSSMFGSENSQINYGEIEKVVQTTIFYKEISGHTSLHIILGIVDSVASQPILNSSGLKLITWIIANSYVEELRLEQMFYLANVYSEMVFSERSYNERAYSEKNNEHTTAIKILAKSPTIHTLDIRNNDFNKSGYGVVCALKDFTNLTTLKLSLKDFNKDNIVKVSKGWEWLWEGLWEWVGVEVEDTTIAAKLVALSLQEIVIDNKDFQEEEAILAFVKKLGESLTLTSIKMNDCSHYDKAILEEMREIIDSRNFDPRHAKITKLLSETLHGQNILGSNGLPLDLVKIIGEYATNYINLSLDQMD